MKRIISFLGILFFTIVNIYAQNLNLTATAPSAVANNSQFHIRFTINADAKNPRLMEDITDFRVLAGPSASVEQLYQLHNGQMQTSVRTTISYVLMPTKEGTFTLPALSVNVGNQKYVSNKVTIKVLAADDPSLQQRRTPSGQPQQSTGVEMFIRAVPSKATVYEQEVVLLTYKLYVRGINVTGLENLKLPDLKGFFTQNLPLPDNRQFTSEEYNNKLYSVYSLSQSLIFPQRTGDLEIEAASCDLKIFINHFSTTKRTVSSSPIKIKVKELPAGKPKSYANAVGNFSLKSSINTTELKENEPVTIKIDISGTGNFRLLKNPEIVFPADFEIYDPKTDNKLNNTVSGVTGTRSIEYLAIPRHAGNFTIPSVEFSYFDLKSQSYKTLRTETYNIKVDKGDGSTTTAMIPGYVNKEGVKMLGNDIRFINTANQKVKPKADFFYGSIGFVLSYLIPFILFIILFIIFRKQAKENANIALVRTKKANKVATKRLKVAQQHLMKGEKEKFYDEVLRALWGYFSDKLSIPLAELTKDNIGAELNKAGVDDELITDVNSILSTCEFARYAPGNDNSEMDKLYNKTVEKIGELEVKIKK